MKLYTEEQVRKAMSAAKDIKYVTYSDDDIVNSLPHIELPSDDEIKDKGKRVFNDAGYTIFNHYNTVPSWVEGAKWMRDKILNQTK